MVGTINDKNLNSEIETRNLVVFVPADASAINDKNLNSEIETHVAAPRRVRERKAINDKNLNSEIETIQDAAHLFIAANDQ